MDNARVVEVDGLTFQVDQELTCTVVGDGSVAREDLPLGYIVTDKDDDHKRRSKPSNTPGHKLLGGGLRFRARITPIAGDPTEIGQWRAGLVQNVVVDRKRAVYDGQYEIVSDVLFGLPMRDGEHRELPFSYDPDEADEADHEDSEASDRLELNQSTPIRHSDVPSFSIPAQIYDKAVVLTSGVTELVTWLALARDDNGRRKVILLGRANWSVSWNAAVFDGQLEYLAPHRATTLLTCDTVLIELSSATPVALGDGRFFPDYRENASMNSYVYEMLRRGESLVKQWSLDDEDGPVDFRNRADPAAEGCWI